MLSMNEFLGLFGLSVSAVNGLMVALDLGISARELRALGRSFRGRLHTGVAETTGLAVHRVEQRVRRLDRAEPALAFRDRGHESEVRGGRVTLDGTSVEVVGAPSVEVWTSEEEKANAGRLDANAFDALYQQAKTARGVLRSVRTEVREGQRLWLVGDREGGRLVASVVATFDPRTFLRARLLAIAALVTLDVLWVAVGAALALTTPHFGPLSIVGALLLLFHLIGITPLAMQVRLGCRTPALAFLHGSTTEKEAARVDLRKSDPGPDVAGAH